MSIPPQPVDANYKQVSSVGYDAKNSQFSAVQVGPSTTAADGTPYSPQVVVYATQTYALPAGTGTTPVTIKNTPGYIHNFVVTTTATAAISFYDNASAASGTVLYTTSSTIAAGTIVVLDMPFKNGLTVSQASGGMAATIGYI